MKRNLTISILTTAFIFCCVFQVHGQDMISPHIDQNGSIFGFDNISTNSSPLKFSLIKDTIKGEWSIKVMAYADGFESKQLSANSKHYFL